MSLAYQPEIIRFPKPLSLNVLGLYFTALIMNSYSSKNIDLTNHRYLLPVVYKNFETLLEISYLEDPYKQYNLKLGNELNQYEPCLHIRFYEQDGEIVSKLVFVRTQKVECSMPENKAGTWLVELTNIISCSLGINTTLLEDDANISCNNKQEKFQMLRIYRFDKASWYQNFGYDLDLNTSRVQNKYIGYNMQQYLDDVENLASYPLSKITDGLRSLQLAYESLQHPHNDVILEDGIAAINVINKYLPTTLPTVTLGKFMSDLWINNCDDYIVINKFLRNSSRELIDKTGKYFNWAPLYRRIEFVGYDYTRRGKCTDLTSLHINQ